jgi:hypothetical protein
VAPRTPAPPAAPPPPAATPVTPPPPPPPAAAARPPTTEERTKVLVDQLDDTVRDVVTVVGDVVGGLGTAVDSILNPPPRR